jgi:hypothetical protein
LAILGRFSRGWVDFGHFWTSFFPFSLFFHFRRRYTRAEEVTLYYRSSQKGFKAPQLGPRAYRILRFCPACGFGIKPLVSLGPIVFECCREHIPDIGTHRTHATVLTVLTHLTLLTLHFRPTLHPIPTVLRSMSEEAPGTHLRRAGM